MSSPLDSPNWSAMIWANRALRPRGHHRVALLDGQLGGWSPSECMRRILDPPQSSTEETVCFLQELTSNEAGGVELSSLSDCSIRASCWVVRTSRLRFSQHVHREGRRDSSSSTHPLIHWPSVSKWVIGSIKIISSNYLFIYLFIIYLPSINHIM